PGAAFAQTASAAPVGGERATFVIRHGDDTVATEEFARSATEIEGRLLFRKHKHLSERYRAVLAPDATLPLVEITVRNGPDSGKVQAKFTERARLIFRDDSVAVDDAGSRGLKTLVLPTERGAVPYLNLSFGLLEQALRRAAVLGAGPVEVPFFNLSAGAERGGQTVRGTVTRVGADSATIAIGTVEFRLEVDGEGRLLGGGIPAQRLTVERVSSQQSAVSSEQ
ncbi:MAG TPA: hypothetical protein VFU46_07150, partial [Gemmatimonadales bacterium]|nr:hypothetical protein [Gemmatimonadales bacterium]